MPGGPWYEIRVAGQLGPTLRASFPEMTATVVPACTVLRGVLDDLADLAELVGCLNRQGLRLLDILVREEAMTER